MVRVGLIGYGYWGPNLARVFSTLPNCSLQYISEKREERQKAVKSAYPHVTLATEEEVLTASDVDIILVATPVFTHYELAKRALENGKHVWLEKPMASNSAQCRELNQLAAQHNRILMVDHTFLFTAPVRKIKDLIKNGDLGDLYYFDSIRVNLGLFQHDVNVIWDLATHDFAIMDFLLGEKPRAICAQGTDHFGTGMEDVAYVTILFDNKLIAHFHLNWLSPTKIRHTMVGGSKKMLVWDDRDIENKIRIYDKGAEITTREGKYGIQAQYRMGDVVSPWLESTEALKLEAQYFLKCIDSGETPFNDGEQGLRVVSLLEATDASLKANGTLIELNG